MSPQAKYNIKLIGKNKTSNFCRVQLSIMREGKILPECEVEQALSTLGPFVMLSIPARLLSTYGVVFRWLRGRFGDVRLATRAQNNHISYRARYTYWRLPPYARILLNVPCKAENSETSVGFPRCLDTANPTGTSWCLRAINHESISDCRGRPRSLSCISQAL